MVKNSRTTEETAKPVKGIEASRPMVSGSRVMKT